MTMKLNMNKVLSALIVALSFTMPIAYADEGSVVVKTQAQKVRGDLKSTRKIYQDLLNQGRMLTQKKRYQEATEVYDQVLKHDPNNATVLGELGFTSFRMGEYKIAQKAAMLCLRHTQNLKRQGSCYYNLGRALEAQKDKEGAAQAYRDSLRVRPNNKIVTARLEMLKARPEVQSSPTCLSVNCEAVPWEKVCPNLVQVAIKNGGADDEDQESMCQRVSQRKVNEALLKSVAIVEVQLRSLVGESFYFVVFQVDGGWIPAGLIAYTYNPGAFGIYEEAELKLALRDVIGGDRASELIIRSTTTRQDVDLGLAEEEVSTTVLEHICELRRDTLETQCYGPLMKSWEYTRDQMPDLPDDVQPNPKLPISKHYQASITYVASGQVTVKKRKGDFKTAAPAEGTHPIRELPKTQISVYFR